MLRSILLLGTLFAFASQSNAEQPDTKDKPAAKVPNYFPCELLTKWEFNHESGENRQVFEVTKVRHERDCKIVTVTTKRQDEIIPSKPMHFRVSKSGVYALGEDLNDEFLLLKFPLKVNDQWTDEKLQLTKTVLKPETLEVPAGKFEVWPVITRPVGSAKPGLSLTYYYADGIGFVQFSTKVFNRDLKPDVLKKFTPPPVR